MPGAVARDGVLAADFVHDLAGLRGFGVGDVDGKAMARGDVGELLRQGLGRQVLAELGECGVLLGEGGFDHQGLHGQLVDALPQGGVGAGVAGGAIGVRLQFLLPAASTAQGPMATAPSSPAAGLAPARTRACCA